MHPLLKKKEGNDDSDIMGKMNLLSPSYGLTWLLYIMQTSVACPGKEVKIKHWSLGRQFILFPENLMRFEGIKINCFSRDQ